MIVTLIIALCIDAISVVSRSAILAFSLADMEELLRKRDRIQALMPKYEAFADNAKSLAETLLFATQIAKTVSVCSLYYVLNHWWPQLAVGSIELSLFVVGIFILLILNIDAVMRSIGTGYPERICALFLGLWRITYILLYVPMLPVRLVIKVATVFLNRGEEDPEEDQAEDDIIAAVALGEAQGHIHEEERDMIEAVLELRDKIVADVMSPRTDMAASSIEDGTVGALALVQETGHSRLPIYDGNRDNIIGILYAKDLIGADSNDLPELRALLREPVLVPASKGLAELLSEMRHERNHLAVVLDEFGGTTGLISIEDIIEEVFGEIEDEYDAQREDEVRQLDEESYDLDARLKVEEVNERFDYNLPIDEKTYESLGGLITSYLGCIPEAGAVWASEDGAYKLTVLEATTRRVVRVCLDRQDIVSTEDT